MEKKTEPWVIFDADNTLWDVESLYDHARNEFAELVKDKLAPSASLEEIEERQNEIDKNLGGVFGYSASRFPRSFEETVLHYLGKSDILELEGSENAIMRDARAIANGVFERRALLFQDTVSSLKRARAKGYSVGILTAGEHWVQELRLKQSGLGPLCDTVRIVEEKNKDALETFCRDQGVDIPQSYFVGDSLRSDIAPASAVGLRTIRVLNKNWEKHEDGKAKPDKQVHTLTEAVNHARRLPDASGPSSGRRHLRVIFEGGGAKGIAHIGALKVMNDLGFEIERTAGSSAGAIIAGLVAARYNADTLLKKIDEDTISEKSVLNQGIVDQIGSQNWRPIKWFRKIIAPSTKYKIAGFILIVVLTFLAIWFLSPAWVGAYVSAVVASLIAIAWFVWRQSNLARYGLASLDDFVKWYNGLLLDSPLFTGHTNKHWITFRDFHDRCVPAPVVIASDLTRRKLVSLTYTETDRADLTQQEKRERQAINDMPVAEAVAASAALPLVFQPRTPWDSEPKRLLVDGGMLSNLPAWSVAEGREDRTTRSPIVAFALTETEENLQPPRSFPGFLQRLVKTSISGVRTLETRDIEGLHVVDIPTSAEVTAFDMDDAAKIRGYEEGREAARAALANAASGVAWRLIPEEKMAPALSIALEDCIEALKTHAGDILHEQIPHAVQDAANPRAFPHLRVNIMWVTTLDTLRIAYSSGMDGDTDDDLNLPRDGGGAGKALSQGKQVIVDMKEARSSHAKYNMTKYEQALVRPTLQTLISIPMLRSSESGEPNMPFEAVLNFDSDDDLFEAFERDEIAYELDRITFNVVDMWRALVNARDVS